MSSAPLESAPLGSSDHGVASVLEQPKYGPASGSVVFLPVRDLAPGIGSPDHDGRNGFRLTVRELSGGAVDRLSPHGPVLARRTAPRRRLRASSFVNALSNPDQVLVTVLSGAWLAALYIFWTWWLAPEHRLSIFGLVVNSSILAYVSGFPVFFIVSANRLRRVNPALAVPLMRVAFVVTHAPSEPWPVARSTLTAMLEQDYPLPYHVWLCTEQPTEEITSWCSDHQVRISSRAAEASYHRATWPRRTKCKEGNLAYFYDHWGYRSYDVVAQLDCDHVPAPGYLAQVVRPFSDPAIGYVAAPSICDANAESSWAARGRVHKEATFHGPFQLGHSDGLAPLCIGSHYAVRTRALRDIGGIGPDLAEDFSTTFLLNAAGWHGAFAIDAEAHGDGPTTFAAMTVQEFQWSRSLTTMLFGLVPLNLRLLSWPMRLRFIYALSYYSLLASTTIAGLALAPVAAVTGQPWINVNYFTFLGHFWLISIWVILIAALLRRRGLLRPLHAPLVSWENWLYSLSRWPYVALGIGAAALQFIRPRPVTFKVTPKSSAGLEMLSAKLTVPFVIISLASSVAALAGEYRTAAVGYIFLSCVGAVVYAAVATLVPVLHARQMAASTHSPLAVALRTTVRLPLLLASAATLAAAVAVAVYPFYLNRMVGW